MSQYSLDGYLAAALIRESRSVLVEGVSDRRFLATLLRALEPSNTEGYVIDPVEMVSDPALIGGNRLRVEKVVSDAGESSVPLAGLIDREDESFDFDGASITDHLGVEGRRGLLFLTRGHSIENYLLAPDLVSQYLRMMYPTETSPALEQQLASCFDAAIQELVCLYRALAELELLQRGLGLVRRGHWDLSSGSPLLSETAVQASLEGRGVDLGTARTCASKIVELRPFVAATSATTVRWVGHGHLSFDGLWSLVGYVAESHGVPADDCDQLERGQRELKMKYLTERWAGSVTNTVDCLADLSSWALGAA